MKLNIEELAKHAGYDVEDGAIYMPVIQACGDPADERLQLKAFARLIVERCAQEAEDTSQEYEAYTGQELSLNYSCAAAIRNLMED